MFDLYQAITDRIIAEMENGIIPWNRPWTANRAISHTTGKPYSFLNQMLLGGKGGEYLTFAECQKEGGKVRKGEKSSFVVFWKWMDKKDEAGAPMIGADGKPEQIPFLRYFNVFHIDQCEGISAKYTKEQTTIAEPNAYAEKIATDYITREHITFMDEEGDSAYYAPAADTIVVPLRTQFSETAEYYSTLFHEMTHSTGHKSRLNRITSPAHFGSEDYSKEELVAEIGAAALVHECGLETAQSFKNSAAYIQNWLQVLKNDKKMIVSASGKAEKAVSYILSAQE